MLACADNGCHGAAFRNPIPPTVVNAAMSLRVLVVGRDPLSRAGLAAILAAHPDLSIVGQVEPSTNLDAAAAVFRPDAVLWDLGWATEADLAALTSAREHSASADDPAVPIVALLSDEVAAATAWQTGVQGVLSRSAPVTAVSAALHAAAHGLFVGEPRLMTALTERRATLTGTTIEPLTPREQEILGWMAQGYANKAIARELGITEHTVKFHVNAVLDKLGAQSRTEAVVVASRAGLVIL